MRQDSTSYMTSEKPAQTILCNLTISSGLLMFGGDQVSAYVPDVGIQEALKENRESPIWKLR